MKKVMFLFMLFALTLFSCQRTDSGTRTDNTLTSTYEESAQSTQSVNNSYQAQWSPDGKDSVVYVNYQKSDGSFVDFYINYLIFRSIFGNNGYQGVYTYQQQHPTSSSSYSTYASRQTEEMSGNSPSTYTSPNRTKTSYTSPNRQPGSSGGSTYTSPNRTSVSSSASNRSSYSSPNRTSVSSSSSRSSYTSPNRSSSRH